MFRCYVGEHGGRVVAPGAMVTCAAYLVHSSQCERLDRHWRNLLMKHDLPVNNPGGWRGIARSSSLSEEDKGAALREFAIAAAGATGFVVAIREATWARVFRSRRRLFGSAEAFCYLRLLRVVLDRLESVQETSPIAVLFRRDVGSMDRTAKSAAKLFKMDTRASERVESMAFVELSTRLSFRDDRSADASSAALACSRAGGRGERPACSPEDGSLPAAAAGPSRNRALGRRFCPTPNREPGLEHVEGCHRQLPEIIGWSRSHALARWRPCVLTALGVPRSCRNPARPADTLAVLHCAKAQRDAQGLPAQRAHLHDLSRVPRRAAYGRRPQDHVASTKTFTCELSLLARPVIPLGRAWEH